MTVLDLFAGAGGWDLAARDLGIETDGVEIMPDARATRRAAGLVTVHHDVWTMPADVLGEYQQIGNAVPPAMARAVLREAAGLDAAEREPRDLFDLLDEAAS